MVLPSSTFSGAPCIYLSRAGGDGERRLDRGKGGSKAGKNGEKGRERGTPCPTSNKLVIIFSQYLSWIGCYFIIFYCLLLLLLPVRKPPSVPTRLVPSATHSPPSWPPFVPLRPPPASRSVLLSRASLRTEGIHSRNSLLRGLFCCNRCSRHSPVPLLPSSLSVSSFVFDRVTSNASFANRSVIEASAFSKFLP